MVTANGTSEATGSFAFLADLIQLNGLRPILLLLEKAMQTSPKKDKNACLIGSWYEPMS